MSDVKIIKLPTIGSPYSYKTRKQGRRGSIEKDIKFSNYYKKLSIIKNNPNKEVAKERVREFINNYNFGSNEFLDSIKKQVAYKGFDKITDRQIEAVRKFIKV